MSLPRLNSAIYELTLPSSGKKIKFRPFNVREQKALMIAMQEENTQTNVNTLHEVIASCLIDKVDDDESANNLIDIINSNLSKYLQVVLTHNTKNKCKILNYLPTLDLKQKWNDNKIYEEFKLNTDEIKLIESAIKKI